MVRKKLEAVMCAFEGCSNEARNRRYCTHHHNNFNKGDKEIGVYVIKFISKTGTYYYVGKAFSQPISYEFSKHKSAIITGEKGKDKKLQEIFEKICLEHPELSKNEVMNKYVIIDILFSRDALGGNLLQSDDNGVCIEVTDKETIKRIYLKKYERFIFNLIGRYGFEKNIDLSDLTDDEREILKFVKYEWDFIDQQETKFINKFKEEYGDYCLNSNKVKSSSK